MVEQNNFLEHVHIYDNFYGTSVNEIKRIQKENKIPVLDVDSNGCISIIKS